MIIIEQKLTREELNEIAKNTFGDMVKAVVDVRRNLLALDAELHADLEGLLLERGSKQQDLWGINLYPDLKSDDMIEFDSMINIRPSQGNRTRGVDDETLRKKILTVVRCWIKQ